MKKIIKSIFCSKKNNYSEVEIKLKEAEAHLNSIYSQITHEKNKQRIDLLQVRLADKGYKTKNWGSCLYTEQKPTSEFVKICMDEGYAVNVYPIKDINKYLICYIIQ
ncbi:MAG: hypothetical protein LBP36_03030 [Oscillospiraceae bacterium]|jgi:hypothetical protein|nr:hypothetical protein [Oscillospiraceae bacterium]